MKYMGIGIMSAACVGAGFFAAGRWKERLEILLLFRRMIFYLKGEILYANEALPEALFQVGHRFLEGRDGIFLEPSRFFLRVHRQLLEDPGVPFVSIWKEEVGNIPKDFPMEKADRQALSGLGENLGYADRKMQERTLLFYLEQLDDSIGYLKKELETRTKLYRSLGTAAGLFLAVIMI